MRRTHGHLAFGIVAVILGVVTVTEALRLHHARAVNAAVATWTTLAAQNSIGAQPASQAAQVEQATSATTGASKEATSASPTTGSSDAAHTTLPTGESATDAGLQSATPTASTDSNKDASHSTPAIPTTPANAVPEARLARAVALAKVDYDGALGAYKAIIQGSREDLRRIALFDLGNLHLRHALMIGLDDEGQSLPLLELAKQSYRDLLRRDPDDWDARYNLERTLRLAPESDDDSDEDTGPPDPREHERSTISDPRMDLP